MLSTETRPRLERTLPIDHTEAALAALAATQSEAGSWKGDYGGPLFLLPMYVATAHAIREPIEAAARGEMIRYLSGHQNADGGWGLHVEAPSYVFTTTLSYVALRMLGVEPEDARLVRARTWLEAHGGPCASASWGKFVLSVLSLYEYDGLDPIPPELWLLPESAPIHPSRLWCHCRMVYLPMSWLYGRRARIPVDALIADLRRELYPRGYENAEWREAKRRVSPTDSDVPRSPWSRAANGALSRIEQVVLRLRPLRARALERVLAIIDHEDHATHYIDIGPVNKLLNTLVWSFAKPGGPELAAHRARLADYLYPAKDGLKMQGYNSSELWDTAFAVQAIVASGRGEQYRDVLLRAHRFIDGAQVREDVPDRERFYRDPSKGGWPFSTREHGWPITDCTAEGLKASLLLAPLVPNPIPLDRLTDAACLILWMQNEDGGWATYERTRGAAWLEVLNPSDCFADIMIDHSYVELTSACVQGLALFSRTHPGVRAEEICRAIARGRDFLLREQRGDGSFAGSWAICFTYGTWFGIWGLRESGLPADHPAIQSAADFLTMHQLSDGGWGETIESCRTGRYCSTPSGQAVMTSWALLALARAGRAGTDAHARGQKFLRARQLADGTWPPEHIAGVFNKTCAIHYDAYLKLFPLWALT